MSHLSNRRRLYQNHPDVKFVPGPFYMGDGWFGWTCNVFCIAWTLFASVLFSLPTYFPVTAVNMNYASVITAGVIILSLYVSLPFLPFSWYAYHRRLVKKGFGISLGMLPFLR